MRIMAAIVLVMSFVLAHSGKAEELGNETCYLDGRYYPEGYELCQGGTLTRCEEGAWADIGVCDSDPTPPEQGREIDEQLALPN